MWDLPMLCFSKDNSSVNGYTFFMESATNLIKKLAQTENRILITSQRKKEKDNYTN